MDPTDMAIVGTGGTAGLGFVLGVVQRYVQPRIDAMRDRISASEAAIVKLNDSLDVANKEKSEDIRKQQEFTSLKIAEVHNKLENLTQGLANDVTQIKSDLAYIKGELRGGRSGR